MPKKDPYVKVCPKCKSVDVNINKTNPLEGAAGLPAQYLCNNCSYMGPVFPEVRLSDLENFEAEVDQKGLRSKKLNDNKVDTSYGDGVVRGYWKILGPLIIIAGIALSIKQSILYGGAIILLGMFFSYFSYIKQFHLRR